MHVYIWVESDCALPSTSSSSHYIQESIVCQEWKTSHYIQESIVRRERKMLAHTGNELNFKAFSFTNGVSLTAFSHLLDYTHKDGLYKHRALTCHSV